MTTLPQFVAAVNTGQFAWIDPMPPVDQTTTRSALPVIKTHSLGDVPPATRLPEKKILPALSWGNVERILFSAGGTSPYRVELDVDRRQPAHDEGRLEVVAPPAFWTVLPFRDPDVRHPVQDSVERDAPLGPRQRSAQARMRATAEREHLTGWDRTTGPSGACGVNKWLNITMPLTLTRAG